MIVVYTYSTTQPAILSELLCILGAEGCVVTLFLTFPNHCLYWRNWFVSPLVAIYIEAKSLIDSSVSLSVAIGGIIMHAYSTFLSSWRSRGECPVRCKLTNSWQTVTVADHLVSTHIMWVYTVYSTVNTVHTIDAIAYMNTVRLRARWTVSYTHLTLPTICSV